MELGIIGFAKSGKTTLFNALSRGHAETAAFGRTSLEPLMAVVKVPDDRLDRLATLVKAKKITHAEVQYLDIGSTSERFGKGDGIAGPLLNALGRCDALIHVARTFSDPSLPHPHGPVDPDRDIATMDMELAYTDASLIERRIERLVESMKSASASEREARAVEVKWLNVMKAELEAGTPVREQTLTDVQRLALANMALLTAKPLLVILNVGEEQIPEQASLEQHFRERYHGAGRETIAVCGQLEMELAQMEADEAAEMRSGLGLERSPLEFVIQVSYALLNFISFFTAGEQETKAWTITRGTAAPHAAGKIHSDMEKGFIRSETLSWEQLLEAGSWAEAKKRGFSRTEGKTYIFQDGDVVNILFSR